MKAQPVSDRRAPAQQQDRKSGGRRGVATLWLVLFLPLFLVLLCFVIEIGNLWLARAELESALEATALAAVQEWGGPGGGSTGTARAVGQTVASANRVRGVPLSINQNYNMGGPNNENASNTFPPTTANLIFGALTSTSPTVVFCPTTMPSCSLGTILLDVSSNSSLQQDNAWGINFLAPNPTATLTLSRVVLNLRAGSDPDAVFDFSTNAPVISDNSPNIITSIAGGAGQNDVFGISNAALTASTSGTVTTWSNSQVEFVWNSTLPHILTINFSDDGIMGGDPGFEPGDRIRFGARVANLSTGTGNNDGDGIGREGVQATLTFAIGGANQSPGQTVTYSDSNFRGTNVPSTLDPDSLINSAPYLLPNSPSSGNNNDGQSFVISSGGMGGGEFAVRAEAEVNVNSVCGLLGPYQVHADATAYFSCADRCPTVIRVDSICP